MTERALETKELTQKTILILGCTGKAGGWILEEALERGYQIRALVRKPVKIEFYTKKYPQQLTAITGSATDESAITEALEGADIVISALGSPNKQNLIMTSAAKSLVTVLEKLDSVPRVIWMSTVGVNDSTNQGHKYGCSQSCCPSCGLCCGYGCMGCLIFNCLIPCVIGQGLWDDMGTAENIFTEAGGDISRRTVIVRPTNMDPASEHVAFSEEWRREGGGKEYLTRTAADPPPNIWISRRAIAAFCLDCVEETQYDGKAISLFQGLQQAKMN